MTLGESITRLRTEKGWSQGDLADALDVSRQSISKWETDSSVPELDKLLKLSDLFGVTLDTLVRGESGERETAASEDSRLTSSESAGQTGGAKHSPSSAEAGTHKVIGVILLCFGALAFFAFLLLGGGLFSLLYAAPFLLCALVCFTVRRHVGLWCAWAVFIGIDLYLRYATGLNWTVVRLTFLWEESWNYVRLAISWLQFLGMLTLLLCTLRADRSRQVTPTRKALLLLGAGWLVCLAGLPLVNRVLSPLLTDVYLSRSHLHTLYFLFSILYSYLHLALLIVLLAAALAMLRWKRHNRSSIGIIDE